VQAEIAKRKANIDAEADAERFRRIAKGEADAICAKMQAQAKGIKQIIGAADGDANAAVRMMIEDKMEEIVKVQVEAVKNLKIDKVTVWDSGSATGESLTANFPSGLMKSLPPMNELFDMAGMELTEYLGKDKQRELKKLKVQTKSDAAESKTVE